jgi:hypothetical protein
MHAVDDTLMTAIDVDQSFEIEVQGLSAKLQSFQCDALILLILMKS